ncbi:hypothetical protein BS50DRAFT_399130 [Corynespora cassiicola Philippines]|uniref:Copper-fist domain-containing protein n=1 Tax=Corynespora cassiicola Philippines TaxID=1448308 RepID=A0A2T2NK95_CORCC|nr:hypothetical protein BS50DRAFT_399130 [Corynespora cassiicola Philippines]
MWAEINGERKKVACGPCIRGHRSSKCDHRDRVLVEVRKPGRPLSSCPHPSGSCSCERVVINYTIPKTSECACPSERAQPVASAAGTSSRVQKSRSRKATNTFNAASLEKALKSSQDTETESSSILSRTPTNPSFAPSEKSASNEASPPSSASSTPRILPANSRRQSQVEPEEKSSCCKPKPPPPQKQAGGCCGSKSKEAPQPAPAKKSCCSGGSAQPNQTSLLPQPMQQQANLSQDFSNFPQYQQPGQFQTPPFGLPNGFMHNGTGNMGMPFPMGFNTPIYNHMASLYQQAQAGSMPMAPTHSHQSHSGSHGGDHNCHCGDSCSCFGCAAHPNNATMTEYIRLMHHYMSTGGFGAFPPPTYDVPAYPHQPGFGAEANQGMAFHNSQAPTQFPPLGQMPFQAQINTMTVPNTPVNVSSPWQQTTIQTPTASNPQYFMGNTMSEAPITLKTEEGASSPAFIDSPSENKDEETPTLSPSAYLWQELVLPGCNDATGTCQCGDGCECVGCLTHGGHDGIPFEGPAQETYTGFTSNTFPGDGTSQFPLETFPEAPS